MVATFACNIELSSHVNDATEIYAKYKTEMQFMFRLNWMTADSYALIVLVDSSSRIYLSIRSLILIMIFTKYNFRVVDKLSTSKKNSIKNEFHVCAVN